MIAMTPGSASALETSMFLIRACGSWLRRILHDSMRGSTMSSANFVWPVHFARASTLRKGLPTTFRGFPMLLLLAIQPLSSLSSVESQRLGRVVYPRQSLVKEERGQAHLPNLRVFQS